MNISDMSKESKSYRETILTTSFILFTGLFRCNSISGISKMSSLEKAENLEKLSLEELTELYKRQSKILENKIIVSHLYDKGGQLREKLEMVRKELQFRKDIGEIEKNMKTLKVCFNSDVLEGKHIQHICNMEKSPETERYKPCTTLTDKKQKSKTEKPTKLIPLAESITLLAEQINKIPVGDIRKNVETTESAGEDNERENLYSNLQDSSDDLKEDSEEELQET